MIAGGLLLSHGVSVPYRCVGHCAPEAVTHPEALMKNAVPSSYSSKYNVRVSAGVTLSMPPNIRCVVLIAPVEAGTRLSAASVSSLASCIVSSGRVGSVSPSGPEKMYWVTSCASCTVDGGALTMNSTRDAGGIRKCVADMSAGGWGPDCELTGTASMPTI